MTRTLRIGTRGSELALVQARWVAARLAEHGIPSELSVIRTDGDERAADTAWGEGAFVGRIVAALAQGSVDVAVHSAKDVPTDEDAGVTIAAYPVREDPRDALVCRVPGTTLATLPRESRVGTDSPRRVAFLRAARPDLQLIPLHGNVDTRLAKLDRGDADALVLAVAGLSRLGRADRIDEILAGSLVAPAPGQGSLALQVRADDAEAIAAVALLDDPDTRASVVAERTLLRATGGGCRSPIGALAGVRAGSRLELVAAAKREWTPQAGATLAQAVVPAAWVRGEAPLGGAHDLAIRLAERLVALRLRPRVLVARTAAQAAPLLEALDAGGIDAVNVPAIAIVPAGPGSPLDLALGELRPGDRIVVTSANAALAVGEAARRVGLDPGGLAWAAVGQASAAALRDIGVAGAFVPSAPDAMTLATELPLTAGQTLLLPRADIADEELPGLLRARGAPVVEVAAYHTVVAPAASRPLLATALDDGPFDALIVTSGSTARGLLGLAADDRARDRLLATPAIAVGAPSAQAAREAGYVRVLVAPSPDGADVAALVADALGLPQSATARTDARAPAAVPGAVPAPTGGTR